ncbi:MAG: 30S ribosomal protein S18 [bacterium]|jgi:small subunit ribosomal protein S18|nr:30S ribosomal protein S18 [Gemmatimonas sp.]MBK6899213.1 30S ribosomal protein S18 [bacterium]MDO9695593.1 30S ribosomal protein S18 [Candidatus Latescibacterota bacterium]MBK7703493.1 30S ribosomal protein S18 [bacterium]MBK9302696.1 30S ribosomal protein S18 [bacterium]
MAKRPVKEKKKRPPKKKKCFFCTEGYVAIDYKDVDLMRKMTTERGKISPRRNTGTCPKHQRMLAAAVKRSRQIALVPFVKEYFR